MKHLALFCAALSGLASSAHAFDFDLRMPLTDAAGVAPPESNPDSGTLARPGVVRCGDLVQLSLSGVLLEGTSAAPSGLTLNASAAASPSSWWLVRGAAATQKTSATHLGCAPGTPMGAGQAVQFENAATAGRIGQGAAFDVAFVVGAATPLAVGQAAPLTLISTPTSALRTNAGAVSFGAYPWPMRGPNVTVVARRASLLRESATTVRCGDHLRLRHVSTSVALHSHGLGYTHAGSSGQQQITGFAGRDENDLFEVRAAHGQPACTFGAPVRNGDVLRLTHVQTGRNLHSHAGRLSPLGTAQEVTGFGTDGVGDSNDDWRLELPGESPDSAWLADIGARLVHVNTARSLRSDPVSFNIWGPFSAWYSSPVDWQQEVSAGAVGQGRDLWTVERRGSPADDAMGGLRRALVFSHRDWGGVEGANPSTGADATADMVRTLTDRGYRVELATASTTSVGAVARWARDVRPGQRRLVYLGAHGGAGLSMSDATGLTSGTSSTGGHTLDGSEGAVRLATLSVFLDQVTAGGGEVAVLDDACEGGNAVLEAQRAGYCAVSTTSFNGPGGVGAAPFSALVSGFGTIGEGLGMMQGALQREAGRTGRIHQRMWSAGCGATQTQMVGRSGLSQFNALGTWVLGADTDGRPARGVVFADRRPDATPVADAARASTELGEVLSAYDALVPTIRHAVSGLKISLQTPTSDLDRWSYAATAPGVFRDVLPDMLGPVDPTPYLYDLGATNAALTADVALLERLQAERVVAWQGLRAALAGATDGRTTLPSAVRDLALRGVSEYAALIAAAPLPEALAVDIDLARLWTRLDGRRSVDAFIHIVRLRWNEVAQDVVRRRMMPLLTAREDAQCAAIAPDRPCNTFEL
jgi:hypothetical protein